MYLLSLMLLLAPRIALPETSTPHLQLVLRWIHFIGGITWVGLLYFFVLVNAEFLKQLDAVTRVKVVPLLMPRALWWFRWASVVTVLAGVLDWGIVGGAANGTPMPAEAAQLARLAQLAARANFVLSFPMLLFMAVASHYPVFGR